MDSDLIGLQQHLPSFASDPRDAGLVHACATAAILVVMLVVAARPAAAHAPGGGRPLRWHGVGTFLPAVALMMAWERLSGLPPGPLEQDEAFFVEAAAQRLPRVPLSAQSVDTGSSAAPVDVFPLVVAASADPWPALASSRLIGLSIIVAGVALLHASATRLHTGRVVRLASLPVATTVALTQYPGFVHFVDEGGPMLLLAFALLASRFGFAGPASDPVTGRLQPFAAGPAAGSTAFAEPRRLPLAVLPCPIFLHANGRKRRRCFPTLAAHAVWLGRRSKNPGATVRNKISGSSFA